MQELRQSALDLLAESSVSNKTEGVQALYQSWQSEKLSLDTKLELSTSLILPGRPEKPILVSPLTVEKRSMRTVEGRAVLIHALTHIEFNAINFEAELINQYFRVPQNGDYCDYLTNTELKIYLEVNSQQRIFDTRKLGMEMKNLGFEQVRRKVNGSTMRCYSVVKVNRQ